SPSIFLHAIRDSSIISIYTLSLHDALPIFLWLRTESGKKEKYISSCILDLKIFIETGNLLEFEKFPKNSLITQYDYQIKKIKNQIRKSTRLNSSHVSISYAVFCLKKKKISK